MWLHLANVCIWFYVKALVMFLWCTRKLVKKEQYLDICVGLGQLYATFGRSMMMRAVSFAIENGIEVNVGEAPTPATTEDDGPVLNFPPNLPPGVQVTLAKAEDKELPSYKSDTGETLPLCFDPLPEYSVFEALFIAKYGRYGRCGCVLMGKPQMFGCHDLYLLLDKIQKDKDAHPQLRAFYGSMMTVIVQRFGHKFDAKIMS